ncbi:hypothetical protein [Sphingopyxis sp.]|uniref:hypothetical protein n=1 Tax=Sphingopyxis sp. TaxID=1908224 RepID=UPI0025FF06F7|nr:hypothetical protein [Sphingopyxis sp.]MBR2173791.1 hypothetical protein [Sphingopyxis sp.]
MSVWFTRAVFRFVEANRLCRILWSDPRDGAYFIALDDSRALPEFHEIDELEYLHSNGLIETGHDPFSRPLAETFISTKSRQKRAERWAIVKPLTFHVPAIFIPKLRGPLITSRCAETGTPPRDIYRDLRRFWQRGMTEQALTPDYQNCGAPGERRVAGKTPLGRPGFEPTFIITPEDEALFQRVIKKEYGSNPQCSITAAYETLLLDHFTRRVADRAAGTRPAAVDPHPSYKQFYETLKRNNDPYFLRIRREGRANVEKDSRAILGSTTSQTLGPGYRFEIDATIANFRLRSRKSRRTVGRPVVYFVVDVFSKLIVGLYIGLEFASWPGAMQALANVVCNKVEYCRRYGISITEDEWPSGFLPEVILGDGGEVAGPMIDLLLTRFKVISETAEPGRGDKKGNVEKRFDMVPVKIVPFVEGWVNPEAKRPIPKHKRDGEFDLDGFTKAMIRSVIYFNNKHQLENFKGRPADMIADGVPAIPLEMFNWGLRNRSGRLRHFDYDDVRLSLLRIVEGTVTESGFEVLGLHYTCDRKFRGRMFEKARQSGVWKERFSIEETFVEEVYWHASGAHGELIPCKLTLADADYEGMTRFEVNALAAQAKEIERAYKRRDLDGRLALVEQLRENREEQRVIAETLPAMTFAERDKDARDNRKAEKNDDDHRKRSVVNAPAGAAPVVPPIDRYALPPLSKLRRTE